MTDAGAARRSQAYRGTEADRYDGVPVVIDDSADEPGSGGAGQGQLAELDADHRVRAQWDGVVLPEVEEAGVRTRAIV